MKISKSKRQLAQLLIEAGVTKFPDGADWAAQDKGGAVCTYAVKPVRDAGDCYWDCKDGGVCSVYGYSEQPIPCWHQTALSREEFDCIVAQTELYADGWIEWSGVPRSPVSKGTQVDVKMQNGTQHFGQLIDDECWSDCWGDANIIAYRPHKTQKSEPQYCESVTRSIPEPIAAPTIDQLLQDWRNADDFAKRKQAEADEAAAMRDERWKAVQARAGEFNVTVGRCDSMVDESELVITDWRNLLVGDIVEIVGSENERWLRFKGVELFVSRTGASECGLVFGSHDGDEWGHGGNTNWRFIRRP